MLSGGGTGGSVTPLLAVAEVLLAGRKDLEVVFVGTKQGPEKEMVAAFVGPRPLRFIPLSGGKWRRYFSWRNFFDLFRIGVAFFQAFQILRIEKPDVVVSAGSFVSVPLVWAAAFKKIPILIHQQDVRPGLANRLMAPFARAITVTFEKSLIDYGPKAVLIGNPIKDLSSYQENLAATRQKYQLGSQEPLLLVIGGGTGARAVNEIFFQIGVEANRDYRIIHLTGTGKLPGQEVKKFPGNYQLLEFLPHEEVLALLAAADLVVSRAGLGVLSELAALKKASIIIPMPQSHQEDNAVLVKQAGAAVVFKQAEADPMVLKQAIHELLSDPEKRAVLSQKISRLISGQAAAKMAGIIWEMLQDCSEFENKK